jgi:hypothetical protein
VHSVPARGTRIIHPGFAAEVLVLAGHDLEQRALAGAVETEDADFRAVVE